MVTALHRCTQYFSRIIYQCEIVYEPTPQYTWKELNQIYLYSVRHNLHASAVNDAESRNNQSKTIDDIYKQTLLLALVDPNHLRQREIQQAYLLFSDWTEKTKLVPISDTNKKYEKYFVDLESDHPPTHTITGNITQNLRGIDIRSITHYLKDHLSDKIQEEGSDANIALKQLNQKTLYQSLINSLTGNKLRSSERVESSESFNLTISIQNTRDYIETISLNSSDDTKLPPYNDPFPEDDNHGLTTPPENKHNPFLQDDESDNVSLTMLDHDEVITFTSATADSEKERKVFACNTINQSKGGYCFSWKADSPNTHIGEILGIVTECDPSSLKVGIVRWIKYSADEELQFGVQIISPSATKAMITTKNNTRDGTSLLLPEISEINQTASLLTHPMQYQIGTELQLKTDSANMHIRITEEVENTSAFTRYAFETTETDQEKQQDVQEDEDDLDSLWSSL